MISLNKSFVTNNMDNSSEQLTKLNEKLNTTDEKINNVPIRDKVLFKCEKCNKYQTNDRRNFYRHLKLTEEYPDMFCCLNSACNPTIREILLSDGTKINYCVGEVFFQSNLFKTHLRNHHSIVTTDLKGKRMLKPYKKKVRNKQYNQPCPIKGKRRKTQEENGEGFASLPSIIPTETGEGWNVYHMTSKIPRDLNREELSSDNMTQTDTEHIGLPIKKRKNYYSDRA